VPRFELLLIASHFFPFESYTTYILEMSNQNGNMENMKNDDDFGAHMERIRTAGSVNISAELFEVCPIGLAYAPYIQPTNGVEQKLYLSPQNAVKGDLRGRFGNPTPIAIGGFLLALTPLSCALMGWRGAGGLGAAMNGACMFARNMLRCPRP
jgi:hypothetical protein